MTLFLLFLISFITGATAYGAQQKFNIPHEAKKATTQSQVLGERFTFDEPPTKTLKGMITSWKNEVKFKSRTATESADLTKIVQIQQGEELETGKKGEVVVNFTNAAALQIEANAHVEFSQTLPANIVIHQEKGMVTYQKTGSIPLSIRSRRLLIDTDDEVSISLKDEDPVITITVLSGKATLAFNDSENISTVQTFEKGKTITFDNDERTIVE